MGKLEPYYAEPKVPSGADIRIVKDHGITAQIKAFMDRDRERKAFFSVNYFKQKYANLRDREVVEALPAGQTRAALLTKYLVYRYWTARPESVSGLERARTEIEEDFKNSPATKQAEQAKAFYGELLHESDLNRIVAFLQDRFSQGESVKAFAKAVSLRILAGRKPLHERLTARILKSGELVRARF